MDELKVLLARIKKQGTKFLYKYYDAAVGTDKYIRFTHYSNGFNNPNYEIKKGQTAFIHIPKTGGTTLSGLLKADPLQRFVNLAIHRPVAKHHSPEDFKYTTVMRDPIERVWSQYQHVKRSEKDDPHERYANQGFKSYMEKCWLVQNLVCRYTSGNLNTALTNHDLTLAFDNLKRFHRVINFKNFTHEVKIFLQDYQIPFENIPNERMSSYSKPSKEEIELIRNYNQLDIGLFKKMETR